MAYLRRVIGTLNGGLPAGRELLPIIAYMGKLHQKRVTFFRLWVYKRPYILVSPGRLVVSALDS